MEEQGQHCEDDFDEEDVASVEVTVPSFDETESSLSSSDDDHMDKKYLHSLKTGQRTQAKKFKSLVAVRDFKSHSKLKGHKITQGTCITKSTSQTDSAGQSTSCEKSNFHPKPRTFSENGSSSDEAERSSPNDDCSLVCHVCAKVFACQKNFDEHQRICATRSKQKEEANPQSSTSSALHTEPQSVDFITRSLGPYLCCFCGQDFDSYEDCIIHEEDKCIASDQHSKDKSKTYKRNQDIKIASSEISQSQKKLESTCESTGTCPERDQVFAHHTSYEDHQKTCSEAASQRKKTNKTKYVIVNGCDLFSLDKTNESHADKSSITTPTTSDNVELSKDKSQTFQCGMCEKNFSTILDLQQHYSDSHDIRTPYPCTLCKTTFVRLCELVRHQQNKKLYLCPTCKKGFRQLGDLKNHEKAHGETIPFICDTCGKNFRFRAHLILHQKKHRERAPNICSHCGKQFSSITGLKAHMVRHTDGFPCPVCGKIFYKKTVLNYHLYKHTGQEPYLCDKCGKGWPTPAQLKIHIVTHREDRPFKCEDCGVTYKRESHLVSHQRSRHGSSRPFVCEVCSMAFRINSELKKHISSHSRERPFSCRICGKTFKRKVHLKKHREKPCL
ncbi:zinc finger protein 660-like [Cheilinus undulatus]|uniref:zinc finger protein 660-like n=1 Tax=Cheilinus undulatus TaxID=241271 RepID=UPI001BD5EA4F|nr:zinc finger protein 660-like [Cheilinus undulatus]